MTIDDIIQNELKKHLAKIKRMENGGLHKMVMGAVEKSLVRLVIKETEGNQSDAAKLLGINRNTLRKKLQEYKIRH